LGGAFQQRGLKMMRAGSERRLKMMMAGGEKELKMIAKPSLSSRRRSIFQQNMRRFFAK
jgi:hypothetical protein